MSIRQSLTRCQRLLNRVKICAYDHRISGIKSILVGNHFKIHIRSYSRPVSMASSYRSVSKLLRFTDLRVAVEPDGARCHVDLPGIPLDYFDRTGSWNIAKLQALLTIVRFYAYHTPNKDTGTTFVEYDRLTEKVYTFMASTKTEFSRDFYKLLDSEKALNLSVSVNLGYIGTSSLNSIAKLYSRDDDKKVFVKNVNQVVTVDKTTRKPIPLPDWWKKRYTADVEENQRLVVHGIPVPEETYHHSLRALWSDMDGQKHINYVAYIRYCFEGAMDACVHKAYTMFSSDILEHKVKSMHILYKGECVPGDQLDIATWQNEDNPYLLHFDISRDGTTIFQNSIEYYSS